MPSCLQHEVAPHSKIGQMLQAAKHDMSLAKGNLTASDFGHAGLPSRAAVLAVAAAHATSSYAVVEQMIQDQEAEDAFAYSQWDQDSDPAKIAAGTARAMRRSGRSGQRQIAFLFPGSEDMPALLEARRLAAEAALRAAQQSQLAVERSQPARLEWPQGPALARPHQSAGLLAEGSSAAQPGHLCMGSASNQAQVPAAEPGASLRDIAGMLARRRLPRAAPRGPSEAQPPRAGMQSLANMLAHRQQPLRPLSSASNGQVSLLLQFRLVAWQSFDRHGCLLKGAATCM